MTQSLGIEKKNKNQQVIHGDWNNYDLEIAEEPLKSQHRRLFKKGNKHLSCFCAPHMVSEFAFIEMIRWADFQNGQLFWKKYKYL